MAVQDLLDVGIHLVPLGQHLVEIMLPEDGTQRRLRQLAGGFENVCHLDHGLLGVDDPEIHDRVDLHRHVVPRNHVLARHVEHDDAQIYSDDLLKNRDHDDQPGPFYPRKPTESEHHAALVLLENLDATAQKKQDEDDGNDD